MSEEEYNNYKAIKPIYRLSTLLGMAPPYDFTKQKFLAEIFYQIFSALVIIFFIIGNVFSLKGRLNYLYPHMEATISFIDAIYSLTMTALNIFCVFATSFVHHKKIGALFQIFSQVDQKLSRTNNSNNNKPLYACLFCIHLVLFALISVDFLVWKKKLTMEIVKFFILRYIQYYHLILCVTFQTVIVLMIKSRLKQLKNKLINHFNENTNLFVKVKNNGSCQSEIKKIGRTLSLSSDLVHVFNKIFGWNIVLLNLNILMGLLSPISLAIVYTKKLQNATFGVELISLCMVWGILVLLCGVIVAASCDYAIKEVRGIASMAYKILQDLPETEMALYDDLLREELVILGQQATLKCPKFSAAGFFYVDFTMLYNILGSVTTYVVVIVQFNE